MIAKEVDHDVATTVTATTGFGGEMTSIREAVQTTNASRFTETVAVAPFENEESGAGWVPRRP